MIGERLKHEFGGNEAWVLSYREECFDQIGLKPSIKIPLYNGSLECEFRKYSLFEGKMKEFRAEGGIVKTAAEKKEMAQKHRFKKNREFTKRLDEESSNEEGDIRSFTFHKHEIEGFDNRKKRGVREHDNGRDNDRKREKRNNRFGGRDERKGGKRFDKGGKRSGFSKGRAHFDKQD